MKTLHQFCHPHLSFLLCVGLTLATGCKWDDDDRDHDPPAGQGSMVVENRTSSDIAVFVDGERLRDVRARNDRYYDLDPGVRRVILDQRGGDRTYRDDIDIIEGRITVLDVAADPASPTRYDVFVFFD
jgi:hypothetical protein